MAHKGTAKLFLVVGIILVILVLVGIFFIKPLFSKETAIKGIDSDEAKVTEPETKSPDEQKEDITELGEQIKEDGGAGGAGGEGPEGGSEGSEPNTEETEVPDEPEDSEPTAVLSLLDFDYQIVENDLVKVTSIRYNVENLNKDLLKLELLLYIYDEDDDGSKKGLVRDQIYIGQLNYGEPVTKTVDVSGYYRGDLTSEKTIKITLIGYFLERSYNLGSDSKEVSFV